MISETMREFINKLVAEEANLRRFRKNLKKIQLAIEFDDPSLNAVKNEGCDSL
jgi:hypothetical protein